MQFPISKKLPDPHIIQGGPPSCDANPLWGHFIYHFEQKMVRGRGTVYLQHPLCFEKMQVGTVGTIKDNIIAYTISYTFNDSLEFRCHV